MKKKKYNNAVWLACGFAVVSLLGYGAKGGAWPWEIYPAPRHPFANLGFTARQEAQEFKPTFVYLGGPTRNFAEIPVIDLNLRTIWTTDTINFGVHTASKASPAVDASGIYVGGDDGTFRAYDHQGNLRWSFRTGDQTMGIHGSPLLDEAMVYFGSYNGRLYCLRKSDGELVWVTQLADAIGSSPNFVEQDLIVSAENERPRNGSLFRIDSRSGAVLWQTEPFGEQTHSSPTISADGLRAYVGDNAGNFQAFSTLNGQRIWSTRLGKPMKGTAALGNGTLYLTSWDAKFWALDEKSGKVLWTVPLKNKSQSSPVLAGSVAVVGSHSPGFLYGIDVNAKKILWEKAITGDSAGMATAAVVKVRGRPGLAVASYCGAGEGLCLLEPLTGRKIANVPLAHYLTSVVTVFGGKIFLALNRGPLAMVGPANKIN